MVHQKRYFATYIIAITSIVFMACTLPRPGSRDTDSSSLLSRDDCICEGGAYPNELSNNYQEHYLAMVIDSYTVNQHRELAMERLKTFSAQAKIRALATRFVSYTTNGQSKEAQLVNQLAAYLSQLEGWDAETVNEVVTELSQNDRYEESHRQALDEFTKQLIEF
jgi:hypothetical protein